MQSDNRLTRKVHAGENLEDTSRVYLGGFAVGRPDLGTVDSDVEVIGARNCREAIAEHARNDVNDLGDGAWKQAIPDVLKRGKEIGRHEKARGCLDTVNSVDGGCSHFSLSMF